MPPLFGTVLVDTDFDDGIEQRLEQSNGVVVALEWQMTLTEPLDLSDLGGYHMEQPKDALRIVFGEQRPYRVETQSQLSRLESVGFGLEVRNRLDNARPK